VFWQLRAEVEAEYAAMMHIPSVQLLVQGGPGSLYGALQSMKSAIPVLVIVDSGGACQAIYEYCHAVDDAAGPLRTLSTASLAKGFGGEKQMAELNEIANLLAKNKTLMRFFRMQEDEMSDDLLRLLLSTIVHAQLESGKHKAAEERDRHIGSVLALAVKWDAPEVAAPTIAALGGRGNALQLAMEMQRDEFVEHLLDLVGLDVMSVDLLRLYTLPEDVKVISKNQGLQERLSEAIENKRKKSTSSLSKMANRMFARAKTARVLPETSADRTTTRRTATSYGRSSTTSPSSWGTCCCRAPTSLS
jgi:hypothetical protein